eukprot:Sspe_Gene.16136::Locus_5672_Transcript_1_1_Confidence_1.000_Length_10014::g.16136::m.16136
MAINAEVMFSAILVVAVGWLTAPAAAFPAYADYPPPLPYVQVNSSWNTSLFGPQLSPPHPTNQWWTDLVDPEPQPSPVNQLPLLVRRRECGVEISPPNIKKTLNGVNMESTFSPEIYVANGEATSTVCEGKVIGYGPFHVFMEHLKVRGPQRGLYMRTLMVRGSPYISFRPSTQAGRPDFVSLPLFHFSQDSGIDHIADVPIHGNSGLVIATSVLTVKTSKGTHWLIKFPKFTRVRAFVNKIELLEEIDGWIQVAYVPPGNKPEELNREAWTYLLDRSSCLAAGGNVTTREDRTAAKANYVITWSTVPGVSCTPLVLTAPNHRTLWKGGWTTNLNHSLQYNTVFGTLHPPPHENLRWEMEAAIPNRTHGPEARSLRLCEKFWLYKNALHDENTLMTTVKELMSNVTHPIGIEGRSEELYALASTLSAARRLGAVKLGERLRQRGAQVLADIVRLGIYDRSWGGYVTARPNRLLVETPIDSYERHQRYFGRVLYGFAQMHDIPIGETTYPSISADARSFANGILRSLMGSGSTYYPNVRNFDWYLTMSWAGGVTRHANGRWQDNPNDALLTWYSASLTAERLELPNARELATTLYALEVSSTVDYWLKEGGSVGIDANAIGRRTALTVEGTGTLRKLGPFGEHMSPLKSAIANAARNTVTVQAIQALDVGKPVKEQLNASDVILTGMVNGAHTLNLFEAGMVVNVSVLDSMVGIVQWSVEEYYTCEEMFKTWEGELAFQTSRRQIWYKDSFNYQVRSVHYEPTVIARTPGEINVYGNFYRPLHERDFERIVAAGFNTIKIPWSKDLYGMRGLISVANDYTLNVIVSFSATSSQVLHSRYLTEENFKEMIGVLGHLKNIIMWTLESDSFENVVIDTAYDYLTLFRQLRRLRDKYDEMRRPVVESFNTFALQQLITGGTNPVDIYKDGVEVIELTILELNEAKLLELLDQVDHPVVVNFWVDSWHIINATRDQKQQAAILRNQTSKMVEYHGKHLVAGIQVTEWLDQYWRGKKSDVDFDCPDKSAGRHSPCGKRVIEFNDGELSLEYLGLNSQEQTWFKHCLVPKEAYFAVAEVFNRDTGSTDYRRFQRVCHFVFLEQIWWYVVVLGSGCIALCGIGLCVWFECRRKKEETEAKTREAQAGTDYVQPDTDQIAKIVTSRTTNIPYQQRPFTRVAIEDYRPTETRKNVAPISGEWIGMLCSPGGEERELSFTLQFEPKANQGYTIRGFEKKTARIEGTAERLNAGNLLSDQPEWGPEGSTLVGFRYAVKFRLTPVDPDEEPCDFVGIWERCRFKAARDDDEYDNDDDEGMETIHEVINGGEFPETGVCFSSDQGFAPDLCFVLSPRPTADPWYFNRWQIILMQLERLQMIIYDEMLCQNRWGRTNEYRETEEGFDHAVATLHYRYLHNFSGWVHAQQLIGGRIDINFDSESLKRKRTDEQLLELLGLFCIWHLGEHLTQFAGHWLHWNLHYFLKYKRFPPTHILSDGRHFQQTDLTFDDINESCVLVPYYEVPHECTKECPDPCAIDLEERGLRPQPSLLREDGTVNTEEAHRYPFRKTFREPRKWGVLFVILHNSFFVVHTTVLMFLFWALIVFFSPDKGRGMEAIFQRTWDVWNNQEENMHFILLVVCKMDFWLVLLHETLDLWIASGIIQSPLASRACTAACGLCGTMVCNCECCCNKKGARRLADEDDSPETTLQHFWTSTTCRRVMLGTFVKMRWSGYTTMISFLVILGQSLFYDDSTVSNFRIALFVAIRVSAMVICNIHLTIAPVRLHGAPSREVGPRMNTQALVLSSIFWLATYTAVGIFQAWVMFRTEGTGFDFCDCSGMSNGAEKQGATGFVSEMWDRIYDCGWEKPRCFTALALIWFSTALMFFIAMHAGFLVGVLFVGGVKHLLIQWKTRKSRQLLGHKMETKFILSAINQKILSFTHPRDNSIARKVWNKVIECMYEEDLLSSYEFEILQIKPHVKDIQFRIENSFARERISSFLEYLQTTLGFGEALGPVACYPSVSVVVPVYNENILADRKLLNRKVRGDHQQQSQLHFLVENYNDEWLNFCERAVIDHRLFWSALLEEQLGAMLQDRKTLQEEIDYQKKRTLKPDHRLREACANRILELFHTRPKLFTEEEFSAIWWWASMRMQTVGRTVRGIERSRETIRFLLDLEADYTLEGIEQDTSFTLYTETMCRDKVQVIIALQRMAANTWYEENKTALITVWERFPLMQVVYDITVRDYHNSPEVSEKTIEKMDDLWDCVDYASCLAVWDDLTMDWRVAKAVARRLPLRMVKSDDVKWGISGALQGKSVNQMHCLPFCNGQLVQAIDCNQDGYFEECLKLRSLLHNFFPEKDRRWSRYKVVGHPEYVITMKSGTVGRMAGYAEYIFNTLFQRVLSVLGVRMHYGHPDYFDSSWLLTQGGMSKPNPRINLNEDIFAGFHIKASQQKTVHIDEVKAGKGRETNFDGAMGFEQKLGMGAAMQYRTRDHFELSRTTNVLERHSLFFGSIGAYLYLGMLLVLVFCTILVHVTIALSGKTDYELRQGGSPYGSEWMVQMSLIESLPLGIQLTLDYGLWGFFQWVLDLSAVMSFFLFVFLTKFHSFWGSVFSGSAHYVATGRMDPLFRRSFRHIWRAYGHTHFMYACLLLALIMLYIDVHTQPVFQSLLRSFFHLMVVVMWLTTPCALNPSLSVKGLLKDLQKFYVWVWGDTIQKIKNRETTADSMAGGPSKNDKKSPHAIAQMLFQEILKKKKADSSASPRTRAPTSARPSTGRSKEMDKRKESIGIEEPTSPDEPWAQTVPSNEWGSVVEPKVDFDILPPPPSSDGMNGRPKVEVERQKPLWEPGGGEVVIEIDANEAEVGGAATKRVRAGGNFAQAHHLEKAKGVVQPQPKGKIKKNEDSVVSLSLEDKPLEVEDLVRCGISDEMIDDLRQTFNKHDRNGTGLLDAVTIQDAFRSKGKNVPLHDVIDHLRALDKAVSGANFAEFVLLYLLVSGLDAQLARVEMNRGLKDLMKLYAEVIEQKVDENKKNEENKTFRAGYATHRDHEAQVFVNYAYKIRKSPKVRRIDFYDSLHYLDQATSQSLAHHFKVTTVLEYRGTSTLGRFLVTLITMAVWLFVYFALWQDVLWNVLYFLIAFGWDYLLCLPQVDAVTILTQVGVFVFIFYRMVVMLYVPRAFLLTLFMSYWFLHILLAIKLSFWSAFGPYLMGRSSFNVKKLDSQREKCLIMLLKDRREQYLFGFTYYMFARRIMAMVVGLIQFIICLLVLFVRTLIRWLLEIFMKIGKYFARKSATETTYIGARRKDEEGNNKKGR